MSNNDNKKFFSVSDKSQKHSKLRIKNGPGKEEKQVFFWKSCATLFSLFFFFFSLSWAKLSLTSFHCSFIFSSSPRMSQILDCLYCYWRCWCCCCCRCWCCCCCWHFWLVMVAFLLFVVVSGWYCCWHCHSNWWFFMSLVLFYVAIFSYCCWKCHICWRICHFGCHGWRCLRWWCWFNRFWLFFKITLESGFVDCCC